MFFDNYYDLDNKENVNYDINENNYETIILDNDDIDNYMIGAYNKSDIRDNKIDLNNGFYLGNIFVDTYKGYKNYKPKKINAYSEREKMLLKIYELDFIINDLNLYLDINPKDLKTYEIFKKTVLQLNTLKDEYNKRYQVLELCKDTNNKYTWINNPWTWEGEANV